MTAKLLDGKKLAQSLKDKIKLEIIERDKQGFRKPGLAVILVGNNPASQIYVGHKEKACTSVGMISKKYLLPDTVSEQELLKKIKEINNDLEIDGLLVQLPLPKHINESKVVETIDPDKDVDGFHPFNFGRLAQNRPFLRPCTPHGIMKIIELTNCDLEGMDAVIIGSSNIVGRPMILELLARKATVTICHSATKNIVEKSRQADLLITATGNPHMVKANWIKPGAIVVDVGINRLDNGKIVGDVDFDEVVEVAGWLTPVPGGVGPMTIASLLDNTLYANKCWHTKK